MNANLRPAAVAGIFYPGDALTLKYAPDLRFRPDETFDRLDETRRLFSDPSVRRDLDAADEGDED